MSPVPMTMALQPRSTFWADGQVNTFIGIGVASFIGLLIVLGVIFLLVRRRRRIAAQRLNANDKIVAAPPSNLEAVLARNEKLEAEIVTLRERVEQLETEQGCPVYVKEDPFTDPDSKGK